MKKILITGIAGFVGSHLSELVLKENFGELHGLVQNQHANLENLEGIKDKLNLVECDITDYHAVNKVIKDVQPDYVFHLAAQAFVPTSWKAPIETMNTNLMGSLNLFESLKQNNLTETRVQIAGSSEEYGFVKPEETPIKETNPLRPMSPYAVSKIAMDMLGYQYNQSYGLKIFRTRSFNHTGPRRGDVYVTSNWSKQIAEIETGKKKPVMFVGNLESKRDFSDVRDIVKAYWTATNKATPGEVYNMCSGKAISMQELLDLILSKTDAKVEVKQDPERMRPSDVPLLLGDNSKFSNETGWKPSIAFEKTMDDLMDYWREKIK